MAGDGGGSGGGRGGGGGGGRGAGFCSSGAAAAFLSERCREPNRTEPPARALGPLPAYHHGEGGGQPAPPALAWPSGVSVLLPAPGLVPRQAQVGIRMGKARVGFMESGAPGLLLPSYQQHLVASRGAGGARASGWVGSSQHPGGTLQNLGPPHQEDCPLLPFLFCTSILLSTTATGPDCRDAPFSGGSGLRGAGASRNPQCHPFPG